MIFGTVQHSTMGPAVYGTAQAGGALLLLMRMICTAVNFGIAANGQAATACSGTAQSGHSLQMINMMFIAQEHGTAAAGTATDAKAGTAQLRLLQEQTP